MGSVEVALCLTVDLCENSQTFSLLLKPEVLHVVDQMQYNNRTSFADAISHINYFY